MENIIEMDQEVQEQEVIGGEEMFEEKQDSYVEPVTQEFVYEEVDEKDSNAKGLIVLAGGAVLIGAALYAGRKKLGEWNTNRQIKRLTKLGYTVEKNEDEVEQNETNEESEQNDSKEKPNK